MNIININFEKLKTPCFIINKKVLDENIENILVNCNQIANDVIVGYSLKTNSEPFLIKYLYKKGLYIEVVSGAEYRKAISLGVKSKKIIYNGVRKDKKTFLSAIRKKSIVNIDSYIEFKWLLESNIKNREIGLRINLPIDTELSQFFEFPKDGSRFGFLYNDDKLQTYINELKKNNILICGIHIHCNTTNRNSFVYKKIIDHAAELVIKNNIDIKYLDIGGGYLGGKENDFGRYSNIIDTSIKEYKCFDNVKIIIEPGAAIIATAVEYFCKVIDRKEIKNNIVVTIDGSVVHINPTFSNKKYKYISNCKNISSNRHIIICGFTCMERDRIRLDKEINLHIGDYLLFKNMGAYVMPFVSNFICNYPSIYLQNEKNLKPLKKERR